MRTGTIIAINPLRGMFVVADVDYGDFFAIELLDSIDLEVGASVSGELEALGGVTLRHSGSGRLFSAFGQSGASSKATALRLIA